MNDELLQMRDNAKIKQCSKCGQMIFYVSTGEATKCPECGYILESGEHA